MGHPVVRPVLTPTERSVLHVGPLSYRRLILPTVIVVVLALVAWWLIRGDDEPPESAREFADGSFAAIEEAATAAMNDLSSVRFRAEMTAGGDTAELDLRLDTDGNCTGSVTTGEVEAEILRLADGSSWLRGNAALWGTGYGSERAAEIEQQVGDRWTVDEQDQFAHFCDLDTMLREFEKPGPLQGESGEERVGALTESDDTWVVTLTAGDPASERVVAAEAPHHLLSVTTTGDGAGTARFSEFDDSVEAVAPAAEDVAAIPTANLTP